MKNILRSLMTLFCIFNLSLSACSSKPKAKTAKFELGKKIQTIEVLPKSHIYAQNDIMLDFKSFEKVAAPLNEDWSKTFKKANTNDVIAQILLFVQVGALLPCFGFYTPRPADRLLWCLGSAGLGFINIPLIHKAQRQRHSVVEEYNKGF